MTIFTLTVLISFLLCAHRSWEKENTVEEEKVSGTYLGNIANDSSNMDKGVYNISMENQLSDTESQLQFILKDRGVPVQSATENLSLSLVISNESCILSGIQVDDEEISHHKLFIAIGLNTITLFVGLIILLIIYLIELNCRGNAANNMEPLDTSERHPPASQGITSSYISTDLELNTLSTENNLRSPKRSPYCDTNVFSLSNSSEMLQTATLTAGQDQYGFF